MFGKSKKILLGLMIVGFSAVNSSALAHNSGKVHSVHVGHKHAVVTVHKGPVVRNIIVLKKKQARLTRRLIRASFKN